MIHSFSFIYAWVQVKTGLKLIYLSAISLLALRSYIRRR